MKTAELPKATSLKSLTGLGVIAAWNKVYLYYRSKSDPPDTFYTAISDDGFSFAKQKKSVSVKTGTYTKSRVKNKILAVNLCYTRIFTAEFIPGFRRSNQLFSFYKVNPIRTCCTTNC